MPICALCGRNWWLQQSCSSVVCNAMQCMPSFRSALNLPYQMPLFFFQSTWPHCDLRSWCLLKRGNTDIVTGRAGVNDGMAKCAGRSTVPPPPTYLLRINMNPQIHTTLLGQVSLWEHIDRYIMPGDAVWYSKRQCADGDPSPIYLKKKSL